jgi:[acyl-carrier-protein] S-malonyltransferase
MQAYLFPGQGSQFPGMAKDLFERSAIAKALFAEADAVMGFAISDIMFNGTEEDLRRTDVTQPAIYIHSLVAAKLAENFAPEMVAGHSLGEFSALAAAGALSFADGLRLVKLRADAMQEACVSNPGTMAAILGLDDAVVEQVCAEITDLIVVPANYNCPGQLVISGSVEGVTLACEKQKAAGAKRCLMLPVGGAFHSPLMEPARQKLSKAIEETPLQAPICPIYQNVDALPSTNPEVIKANLIAQLTAPVRWTQTVQNMAADGATHYTECGPGNVLQGLVKKIHKEAVTASVV